MTTVNIIEERLAKLPSLALKSGSHPKPPNGNPVGCVMELASWVVGEPWSDHPKCACPVITEIMIRANDRMGDGDEADARRARVLSPLIPVVVGARSTRAIEEKRRYMAANWSLRSAIPRLFRCTQSIASWGNKLAALPEIVDKSGLELAYATLADAREAAWASRSEAWNRLRNGYWKTTDAATAAAAAAAADADATADATTTAAATAAAATATAAAAAAAADADADAVRRIFDAAHKKAKEGGDWNACYMAALPVAREFWGSRRSPFASIRDEIDAEFVELVKQMAAVAA
jgi:hypothetical protein